MNENFDITTNKRSSVMAGESEYDIKQPKFHVSKTRVDTKNVILHKHNQQVKVKKYVSSSSNRHYPRIQDINLKHNLQM